jgi:predicted nucleotidyltransferase
MSSSPVDTTPSGRFVLRIDPELHGELRRSAGRLGMSLNEYCARRLMVPLGGPGAWGPGAEAVTRAATIAGSDLVAVVLFGSWARGEAGEESDIDVLVVLDRSRPLSRSLYSEWDVAPIVADGHRVEPHFVHLPEPDRIVLGLWAEVAVDGIVLFCRDLVLPSRLASIRRDIADGTIVRKVSHGQPYWVRAA